jgi:hypothetical protein
MTHTASDVLGVLREPATIRARCAAVTRAVDQGRSAWFRLDRSRLDAAVARVERVTRARFPDLAVPLHSRWRHFAAGGVDRKAELDALLAGRDAAAQARARFDLTVLSVLLDAGAGPQWRYREPGREASGEAAVYLRAEGLAVASLRAFVAGAFSAAADDPLRVDARALQRIEPGDLRRVFQVSTANPLVGLDGRVGLLGRLGEALAARAGGDAAAARPGALFDRLTDGGARGEIAAADLLRALLGELAPIWRSGARILGHWAGDVWPHRWAGDAINALGHRHAASVGWVPLHAPVQWLAYSLVEPLQWAGVRVTGLDALTGLPDDRSGGLLIDAGVIVPRDARDLARVWKSGDELVVEWRALAVTLLDELAGALRLRLGMDAERLPLPAVIEGGTWAAGREIAAERRKGATPPLAVDGDGTPF